MKLKYVFLIVTSAIILNNCGGGSGDLEDTPKETTPSVVHSNQVTTPTSSPTTLNNEAVTFPQPQTTSSSSIPTDQLPKN